MKIKNLILFAGNGVAGLIVLQLVLSLLLLNGNVASGKSILISFSLIVTVLIVIITFIVAKKLDTPFQNLLRVLSKAGQGEFEEVINVTDFHELKAISEYSNSILHQLKLKTEYLDNIPTPVLIIDKEFSLEYINKAGANLTDKTPEECISQKCYDLFKTGHCKSEKCRVGQAMRNGDVRVGYTIANPVKATLPIMYTGSPIKNESGQIIGGMDFIADITEMDSFQKYLEKSVDQLLTEMEKFANGDLTVKVKKEKNDTIGKLFDGFNEVAKNMRDLINHVIEAVQATASASAEISSSAEQMAAGAQEQSAQTTEVAGAVEQMTATIIETTKNAGIGAELTKESSDLALEGGGKVSAATEGMKKIASVVKITSDSVNNLSASTNKISNIIQVIDEIADQTNLLALNAAIEAARAGEEGRGFAVVADEVRKLAERTSKATKEITGMIKQIQQNMSGVIKQTDQAMNETEKGINLANEAAEELEKIIETSRKVSDTVDQVASASEEQSATAEQISKNIEQINNVTNESASGVQQIAKASEDLNRLTENLQQIIEKFKVNRTSNENNHNDFSSNLMVNSNGEVIL